MKSIFAPALGAACLVCSTASLAQSVAPPATAQPAAAAPAAMTISSAPASVLPQGTNIRLRSLTELHSQHNRTGDRFDLEVAEDVMLNGLVVIPRGSPGVGEVTRVRHKGMWGRSGRLETRVLSVRANGMTIPITGTVAERGETGTAGVVASILVIPVAGFFVTGTSAILPAGTGFAGTTNSDTPIVHH
jgi:glucose/arabinose dehydrogenase